MKAFYLNSQFLHSVGVHGGVNFFLISLSAELGDLDISFLLNAEEVLFLARREQIDNGLARDLTSLGKGFLEPGVGLFILDALVNI